MIARLIRQTAVIARRDFIATVATPTFLIFLFAPFFMIAFGIMGGLGASHAGQRTVATEIVVMAAPEIAPRLNATDAELRKIYRDQQGPPVLRIVPSGDKAAALALFHRKDVETAAILYGALESPQILVSDRGARAGEYLALVAEQSLRAQHAAVAQGERLSHANIVKLKSRPETSQSQEKLGFAVVFSLFFLTLLLAGQAVGTMAEEKSSKVIEILAAAVPLEAVFMGKLVGMFGVALLFIGFWGALLLFGIAQLPLDPGAFPGLIPAIGTPTFLTLAAIYFTMGYLLLGAIFLGVGAQAGTVREIQLLSLPITLFQVGMFGLSSAAAAQPTSMIARIAEIFPFSSPFAMAARGATDPALWPHIVALGWQLLWVAITITLSARFFRRGVLKSGSMQFFRKASKPG